MSKNERTKQPSGESVPEENAPEENADEGLQLSSKRGKASDSKKSARSRHGYGPAPETSHTSGAFGAEVREERGDLGEMGAPVPGEEDTEGDEV